MVNRHYFFSFKWIHNDGTNEYKYQSGIVSHKSIFGGAKCVYGELTEEFIRKCKAKHPKGDFIAIAFNRI